MQKGEVAEPINGPRLPKTLTALIIRFSYISIEESSTIYYIDIFLFIFTV